MCASAIVLLAGLTACGSDRSTSAQAPPPAHHTTSTASTHPDAVSGAAQIVDSPRARLGAFSAVPGHPGRRLAEWYVCRDRRCYHRTYALVVSGDGFGTRHVVDLGPSRVANGWYVEPAGPDHFAISPNGGRRTLVDLAGRVTRIHAAGPPGPLVGREVPLRSSKAGFLAVDPDTGEAHPLATPPEVVELDRTPSGQLRAVSFAAYSWSDDGGATWQHLALHLGGDLPELVPSASDHVQAVLVGGDGATLFPWLKVLETADGAAWRSYPGPHDPTAYVDSPVVQPDGRLLINVETWSDQRAGAPAPRRVGMYVGHLRSAPSAVAMGAPFDRSPNRSILSILDVVVAPHSVTVYGQTPEWTGVFGSSDGGATWHRVRAR